LTVGGHLVFEVRDPKRRAWLGWTRHRTERRLGLARGDRVRTWTEVTQVALPLVSFRTTVVFETDGTEIVSDSTLRFRDHDDIVSSLRAEGFAVAEVRQAPDRPGLELVFVARKS
jgi:hypothetical protein